MRIIKVMEVTSRERIGFPKEAKSHLNVKIGDYVAFIGDDKGIRVVKVKLDETGNVSLFG